MPDAEEDASLTDGIAEALQDVDMPMLEPGDSPKLDRMLAETERDARDMTVENVSEGGVMVVLRRVLDVEQFFDIISETLKSKAPEWTVQGVTFGFDAVDKIIGFFRKNIRWFTRTAKKVSRVATRFVMFVVRAIHGALSVVGVALKALTFVGKIIARLALIVFSFITNLLNWVVKMIIKTVLGVASIPLKVAKISGLIAAIAGVLGISALSDERKKHDIGALDADEVLDRFERLPIKQWRYKPTVDPDQGLYYGPMVQAWNRMFPELVKNETMIPLMDREGVMMATIQALAKRMRALEAQMDAEGYGPHTIREHALKARPGAPVRLVSRGRG